MNNFSSYEKMANNINKLGLSEKELSAIEKLQWLVTEKVHGANFSFVYSDKKLGFAKRKDSLSWDDDFFGFQLVATKLENRLFALFEQLSQQIPANQYTVYGELFGGHYPHPDVKAESQIQAIQTGVYYCPSVEFMAFDIAIRTDTQSEKFYLDYATAIALLNEHGILAAQPLFKGKLSDAMLFDTRINSTIPTLLGLPPLKDNLIEGVVIKPYNLEASNALSTRPIFKIKNAEFDEKESYYEARKWSYKPDAALSSEAVSFLLDDISHYINANRLHSAISKIGHYDKHNNERNQLIEQEMLSDILTDFDLDNDHILGELNDAQLEWLKQQTHYKIVDLINSNG